MALRRRTTVVLPAGLHRYMRTVARRRHTSLGQLVRSACESRYGRSPGVLALHPLTAQPAQASGHAAVRYLE